MDVTAPKDSFLDEDKALACVHCGLCLGSCPTFLETGNENDSPRGRIYLMRAMESGRLPVAGAAQRHIDLCLGCRACESACPSGVEYGALLELTRERIEQKGKRSWPDRFLRRHVIEKVFPYPARMKLALLPGRLAKAAGMKRWGPRPIRDALALLPEHIHSKPLEEFYRAEGEAKGTVGFISGCVMSVMFSRTHESSVRLLRRTGFNVVVPGGQVCCGALHAHGGRLDQARAFARRNIEVFARANVDSIIINAAGCGSTLKEYGHLLKRDDGLKEAAVKFSQRVVDLTEWLVERGFRPGRMKERKKTTYHDACHLAHAQRVTAPPRALVRAAAGEDYVELPEADICCGSAGSYNLTEPEMAARLQDRKVKNVLASGAEIVVSSNPGCLMQIEAGLKKAGAGHIRAMHIADYLCGDPPAAQLSS